MEPKALPFTLRVSAPRMLDVYKRQVMVTAANDGATVDTLLKMGVVDYLVKPFTVERCV